ncbi:hypothetical protein [Paenibacillus xylanilyticus]|uniref:Uncharacterized protein n=1 Tax=Paenibacillus xylanilyticus TaxID=248903 RepID=A0A7Y6BXJ8_9BACL|nr:hypothetical protein [Paenibacillus xylanilyticus]NUU76769.1 hypothetical protein [Paenibacillus xylanilyticus]
MSLVRLSIPVGMLVENVLTSGEASEVIIDCLHRRDLASLRATIKEPMMDLEERLKTAEEVGEDWAEAIRSGYEFKFLHINALKRVLDFRFDLKLDRDYVQEDLTLRHLKLNREQIQLLHSLVGRQWSVIEDDRQKEGLIPVDIKLKYQ